MSLPRIRRRVSSAFPLCHGYLPGHELRFHKRSVDGSAKADAFQSGGRHAVWGVLFEIARDHKPALDRAEFLGIGYDEKQVEVVTAAGTTASAWVYCARDEAIDPGLKPYGWYHGFVVSGAREHGLPEDYIADLETIETTVDPDPQRHRRNLALLEAELT